MDTTIEVGDQVRTLVGFRGMGRWGEGLKGTVIAVNPTGSFVVRVPVVFGARAGYRTQTYAKKSVELLRKRNA